MIGLALRYVLRDVTTIDTFEFLLPWYEHAHAHGVAGLGRTFTNYTPFYSYLLLIAAQFHGLLEPWHLIKTISFIFELALAITAARLVALASPSPRAPPIAFSAVFIAPTVLYNGGAWGQSDALWTFFILLSVYFFCQAKPGRGVIAFGIACAIKAQAVFLSPLLLALVLRGRVHFAWLAAVPAAYLLLALPAWLSGLPVSEIVSVYLKQAVSYKSLSKNAANLWLLVPNDYYEIGVVVGLILASASGLMFSICFARSKIRMTPEQIILAAALILLLMPFVLPKMHERYFFGFEVMAIVLACIRPRLIPLALAGQFSGVGAYSVFSFGYIILLYIAMLTNIMIVIALAQYARKQWGGFITPEANALPAFFSPGIIGVWTALSAAWALQLYW